MRELNGYKISTRIGDSMDEVLWKLDMIIEIVLKVWLVFVAYTYITKGDK